jgi:FKBP-type peptidyl-prolyl cis-trans isomerase
MKTVYSLLTAILLAGIISCGQLSYKKTKSGLIYKIIPSNSKDSAAKPGQWLKFHFVQKRNNDSVLQSSYGRMPVYQQVTDPASLRYNPAELFTLLKKGDSLLTIIMLDTIVKQTGQDLPPYLKKSDRIYLSLKIIDVFTDDSLYNEDRIAEEKRYEPIRQKEMEEEMAKMRRDIQEQQLKTYNELEKSGEAAQQRKVVEDYLAAKGITAQKTGKGTYVHIMEQGTGAKADSGKYVTIKYSGRRLANDSTFETNVYPNLLLGVGDVIAGWDEGLQLFNEGGKGTIYIPGYNAYGKTPRPGPIKPDDALIFDVEILKVADKPGE